jgi:hypothetical protein
LSTARVAVPEQLGGLDRILRGVGDDGVRKEEVVPVGHEAEEEDEDDDRLGQWERDAAKGQPLAAAVRTRRIEEVARDRGHVVDVGEVDPEGEEREGQDHRERVADQVQRVELEEDRKHEGGARHDHHDQRQRQHDPAAGEGSEGQAVARRDRGGQHDRRGAEGVHERVADPGAEDVIAEGIEVPGRGSPG